MFRMEYDRIAVGARMQAKRKELHITQEKLAEMIDKSVRLVVDVERGVAGMSIETLLRTCNALKTTPNDLLLASNEEDHTELDWLLHALENSSDHVRAAAIDILKAYLRSV